jgi:hypothetical protein
MLNIETDKAGNLVLTLDPDEAENIAASLEKRGYWSAMAEMFEQHSCNGSYTPFDASDGDPFVGLTSAPCIAECMHLLDDGTQEIEGRFWYSDNYMLINEVQDLIDGKTVTFTLYRDDEH